MSNNLEKEQLSYVPTDASIFYPEEDGKPMAASDLHRHQLMWTLQALEAHFSNDPSVYISGDILMYYEQGSPNKSISPDVLVSFGIGQKKRRTYNIWEEGKCPEFVMEFSSRKTYKKDLTEKKDRYASIKIQEYLLYDAEGLYLSTPLMGFELIDNTYIPIQPDEMGGFLSKTLGLSFHIRDEGIGIYDPVNNEWVRTRAETAEARAEQHAERAEQQAERAEAAEARAEQHAERAEAAEARAEQHAERAETAEARAEQQTERAKIAEAEIAKLQKQLEELKAKSG